MRFVFFRSKLRGIRPLAINLYNTCYYSLTMKLQAVLEPYPYDMSTE
ncbi:hypothetical protein PsalMR5_00636 [Piscirickettsia salmonis]|nr:hypothetical protein [Piscirickettsia salmonis]QGP53231.1 hypothetical protein PsalSR1_00637 [Piscirickettsia salmonis]QGP60847.1 hypothetical protein PsalBI1_03469 [Piscirickettsia salmonis]QGP62797.1 hypothetical protein PsalMR5_00636 [Piscirickettsia salmonis]